MSNLLGKWVIPQEVVKWRKTEIFQCVEVSHDGLTAMCHPYGFPDKVKAYTTERLRIASDKEISSVVVQSLTGNAPQSSKDNILQSQMSAHDIDHYFQAISRNTGARFSVDKYLKNNNICIELESSKTKCCSAYQPIRIKHVCSTSQIYDDTDCEALYDYLTEKMRQMIEACVRDGWPDHPSEAHK